MSDEYDEIETEDGDFHEAPEANLLSRYEEIVFCPQCDAYMPYHVEGALVRRKCPVCGKLYEGGAEVDPGKPTGDKRTDDAAKARGGAPVKRMPVTTSTRPAARSAPEDLVTCAALTKAGTPCSNLPRKGSKYCATHRGYRPR